MKTYEDTIKYAASVVLAEDLGDARTKTDNSNIIAFMYEKGSSQVYTDIRDAVEQEYNNVCRGNQ